MVFWYFFFPLFIQISDTLNPQISRTICGDELMGEEWLSRDPNVILGFVSDLNGVEGTGFSIFSTLQPCPVTGFVYELVGTVSKNTVHSFMLY